MKKIIVIIIYLILLINVSYAEEAKKDAPKEEIDKILSNGEFPWYKAKENYFDKYFDGDWDWNFGGDWDFNFFPDIDFPDIDIPDFDFPDFLPKVNPNWECPFSLPDFKFPDINKNIVIFILILLGVVIIALIIRYIIKRRGLYSKSKKKISDLDAISIENLVMEAKSQPELLLEKAIQLAKEGKFSEAVCLIYHAALFKLNMQEKITYHKSLTNWEYIYQLNKYPNEKNAFTSLVTYFERIFFGKIIAIELEFENCLNIYNQEINYEEYTKK